MLGSLEIGDERMLDFAGVMESVCDIISCSSFDEAFM